MNFNLAYFNNIDIENLLDYYEVNIALNNRKLQLDLNFENVSIEESKLIPIRKYLDNLVQVYNIGVEAVLENYYNDEEVKEFLTFHKEELDEADIQTLISKTDKSTSLDEQILSLLELKRIGFYPEHEENYATLDFTINEKISQYLLVVKMNSRHGIEEITMES